MADFLHLSTPRLPFALSAVERRLTSRNHVSTSLDTNGLGFSTLLLSKGDAL